MEEVQIQIEEKNDKCFVFLAIALLEICEIIVEKINR